MLSVDQLNSMLSDMYELDTPYLYLYHRIKKDDFRKASYYVWAIDEIKQYVVDKLHPRTAGPISSIVRYVGGFKEKMQYFSKLNNGATMFETAVEAAADVLDLLQDMES